MVERIKFACTFATNFWAYTVLPKKSLKNTPVLDFLTCLKIRAKLSPILGFGKYKSLTGPCLALNFLTSLNLQLSSRWNQPCFIKGKLKILENWYIEFLSQTLIPTFVTLKVEIKIRLVVKNGIYHMTWIHILDERSWFLWI